MKTLTLRESGMVALKTTSLSLTSLSSKRLDAPALAALAPVLRPRPHPTATMSFRVRLHSPNFSLPSYVTAVNGLWSFRRFRIMWRVWFCDVSVGDAGRLSLV